MRTLNPRKEAYTSPSPSYLCILKPICKIHSKDNNLNLNYFFCFNYSNTCLSFNCTLLLIIIILHMSTSFGFSLLVKKKIGPFAVNFSLMLTFPYYNCCREYAFKQIFLFTKLCINQEDECKIYIFNKSKLTAYVDLGLKCPDFKILSI